MMLTGTTPTLTATAGIIFLGAGAIGYFKIGMNLYERGLFLAAALLLIIPGWATDLAGLGLGSLGITSQMIRGRNLLPAGGAAHG
jgi:TRAP-type uncharacterized transport system fused permease subunit